MHAAAGGHAVVALARRLLDCGAPWNALSPSGLSAGDLAPDSDTYDLLLDHALRSELVLGTVVRRQAAPGNVSDGPPAESYLESRVSFRKERVMNAERKAVVMAWERPLMEANARAVCQGGGKVLNVGFGMGA
jgi:type IV protein arginine methyltransferase